MKRALLILICACGSKKPAPPPCDDLRPMVDRMYTIEFAQQRGGMTPDEEKRVKAIGEQVAPAMKDAIVSACRADVWPADVIACMAAARGEASLDECEARLPKPARDRVEAAMAEVVTNIAPSDEPAQDEDDFGAGESGVPECDAYAHAMEAYVDCDEIAQPVKDSAKQGLEALRHTWPMLRDPQTPASAKSAARDACVRAREELEASAKAQGCGADHPAGDCRVLGPMLSSILAEQLRDVPADKQAAAAAQSKALAAPLEQSLVETCTTGRWSAEATACFGRAHDAKALVACEAMLTPDQANALAAAMEKVTSQLTGPASAHVTACDDYLAAVNQLLACDTLPADDRARMQRSTALVIDGLKKLPAAHDLGATCAKALDAATALAAKLGC